MFHVGTGVVSGSSTCQAESKEEQLLRYDDKLVQPSTCLTALESVIQKKIHNTGSIGYWVNPALVAPLQIWKIRWVVVEDPLHRASVCPRQYNIYIYMWFLYLKQQSVCQPCFLETKAKMYTGLMESARGTGAKLQDVVKSIVSCRICGVLKLFDSM